MPVPALQKWSKMTGKSLKECEKAWEDAKKQADKKFKTRDSHYWAYVTIVTERKLGVEKIKKEEEKKKKAEEKDKKKPDTKKK